jgi:anti-sigma factor RsiW
MNRPVSEEELHAYVDDTLDDARRYDVERYLAEHGDDAARVRDYAAQRHALRTALAFRASTPAPPELNLLRLLEARKVRRQTAWRIAAAVVLSLGVGGAAGWLSRGGLPSGRAERAMALLTDEAFASHTVYAADQRHPIEVEAAEHEHLARWLSNRLNRKVDAPDLIRAGYQLLGGRLLATERGGAAALFMFADKTGRRVSVLVRPMASEIRTAQTDTQNGPITVCAWIESGLGYAVAGPLPDEELDHIADLIKASARAQS